MKKAHQFLLKSFVFVIAISVAVLTFVGCKNKEDESNNNINNVSTVQPITGDNSQDNTADLVGNKNPSLNLYEIKSIYEYAKNPNFNNVTYDNIDAVLKFFNTRDLNGVHKAAKKLGFDTFIANEFILDDEPIEYFVSIDGTESPVYTTFIQDEFGTFLMLDENKFNYELVKNIFINENGNFVLQIQFTYTNEAGETIETPLMINLELTKIATYIVK
jgi:hypothetical protein